MNKNIKIGVFTDVHGNLPALLAGLNFLDKQHCDYIYHTGDAIGFGPFSRECVEMITNLPNIHAIMGNHEQYFIYGIPCSVRDLEKVHHRWVNSTVRPLRDVISKLKYVEYLTVNDTRIAFMHYGMLNENKFNRIIEKPNGNNLDILFNNIDADIIFYGHNHESSDIIGKKRYINPGSMGCSRDSYARLIIIEFNSRKYKITKHKILYDKSNLFKQLNERDVPGKEYIAEAFFGLSNSKNLYD